MRHKQMIYRCIDRIILIYYGLVIHRENILLYAAKILKICEKSTTANKTVSIDTCVENLIVAIGSIVVVGTTFVVVLLHITKRIGNRQSNLSLATPHH